MAMNSRRRRRSVRHQLRSCLDHVSAVTGLLEWYERRMCRGLTILMYHRVLPAEQCAGYPLESLIIPATVFREQMRWLAQNCEVLPVVEAVHACESHDRSGRPLVAVTFDDGYADNCEIAAGILEEYDLRGTFFVTSEFVELGEPMWFDRAADAWTRLPASAQDGLVSQLDAEDGTNGRMPAERGIRRWMEGLKRAPATARLHLIEEAEQLASGHLPRDLYRAMTVQQVSQLHCRGHEIGSHAVTHPLLSQLPRDEVRRELSESRDSISRWIGDDVRGLCYPNGDFNSEVEALSTHSGYVYGCTMRPGLNRQETVRTRLSRLSITMQRTVRNEADHDELGFRSELSQLRGLYR